MSATSQQVLVTYAAPGNFLSTDSWKQLYAALVTQLPLRNLHWKSLSRPSIRTIQELNVKFVPVDSVRDEQSSQVPQTVLEKPLLNLYIVTCEDAEVYKNTIRKHVKDWHASVSPRKNQEWLVVHVMKPEGKAAQSRIFQMKASVLDRMKADFNTDKRDRCVQLVWSHENDVPTAWADLVSKLKDGILSAFDGALTQREEEVKRSEGQRQMPGWNFCTFFILKESLAMSFEGMVLLEEALQQYNELEGMFSQVVREKNLSWFGTLISPGSQDDSAPLLSVAKKAYRDLILANSISVFDFRVYLLARQCGVLSKLGDVIEIGSRVVTFLSTFGKRLKENEHSLPKFFVESWIYSSAMSVVEQCDIWSSEESLSKADLAHYNAIKGELVELGRHQLDIIGVEVGHLPSRPPFSLALPSLPADFSTANGDKRTSRSISRTDLISAIDDMEAFYELYVNITRRAIELYANAGRRKFALKLHGSLAALDVHRGQLMTALETYKSLPAHYSPHSWTSMEAYMLTRASDIHTSSERPKDADWIHMTLHFLKAYVEDMGQDLLMGDGDFDTYISSLVTALTDAARRVDADIPHLDHPAISLSIADKDAKLAETRDGALVDVVINNRLPCEISVDEVNIQLVGREGAKLLFLADENILKPGATTLTLFCPSSAPGTYALHSTQIRVGHLLFQWTDNKLATWAKQQSTFKRLPSLIRIPRDVRNLDVQLRQPRRIELGTQARVLVLVHTGRNYVTKATVKLSLSGVTFHHAKAVKEGKDDITLEADADSVILYDVGKESTVILSVPHSDASKYEYMKVNVLVDYTTAAEPDILRTVKVGRSVATGLPVAINVEDFFRGTRLFTCFTLSSTSHQHIRIRSTQLRPAPGEEDSMEITSCRWQQPSVVTVTPQQPGKFLFQLDAAQGGRESLQLQIEYRGLREEVQTLVDLSMEQVLVDAPSLAPYRDNVIDKVTQALEKDAQWVRLYGITGELHVPGLHDEEGHIGDGVRRLKEVLSMDRSGNFDFGDWREVAVPVDMPRIHILAATRLQVLPSAFSPRPVLAGRPRRLFAGQPISAVVTINTSFQWAPSEYSKNGSYHLRYDIEEMTQDWLVSGRKKGDFIAKDGQTFSVPVTLIALHHGELALPKVGIIPLPLVGESRMGSVVLPNCETYQLHGAERVLVSPRGGRSTFIVNMGHEE